MARNYRGEYDNYHSRPEQKKNRARRNAARRIMKRKGVKLKGKDVHHRDGNPRNNSAYNLVMRSISRNRSRKRG